MSTNNVVRYVGAIFVIAFAGCTFSDMGNAVKDPFDAGADRKLEGSEDGRSGIDATENVSEDASVVMGGMGGTSEAGAGGQAEGGGGASTGGIAGSGGIASGGTAGTGGEPTECTPNATEEKYCGVCFSGKSTRICDKSGNWDKWGDCEGEVTDYPHEPTKDGVVCPEYIEPAVFFAAHPGDESIAMAGAIRHQVKLGHHVFVELLTHGESTQVRKVLNDNNKCGWHGGKHVYSLTGDEIGKAFVAEFIAAVISLGVKGIYISNFPDGKLQAADVKKRVDWWIATGSKGLSLKGIAGGNDRLSDDSFDNDNRAVWDALLSSGFKNTRGYFVNHYISNKGVGALENKLGPYLHTKRIALDAYKLWNPAIKRYGIGYHSKLELIDKAWSTDGEYYIDPWVKP